MDQILVEEHDVALQVSKQKRLRFSMFHYAFIPSQSWYRIRIMFYRIRKGRQHRLFSKYGAPHRFHHHVHHLTALLRAVRLKHLRDDDGLPVS